MSFVHLHTHSHYSLLDGVPKIPELIAAAKRHNMPAIALTDHGNLYGALEFYEEARKNNIQPIIGCELYCAPGTLHEHKPHERPFHLTVLAENIQGYYHLIKLVTSAHLEGFYGKPRIDLALLTRYHQGLILLSGCLSGEIPRAILNNDVEKARAACERFRTMVGKENFFLELQHRPNTPEQTRVNEGLLQLHEQLDIPVVATNDAHYVELEDAEAQDILVCIQTKKLLTDRERLSMRSENYALLSPHDMMERFAHIPEAIDNTLAIAERVEIDIPLGRIQLPHYNLPLGITPFDELCRLCEEGLNKRYHDITPEIRTRLAYELDVIRKTGFASYFLIVQDFINWAKRQGIAVGPGRGSAAGSIVAYLTGITDIDPIRYDLLFERFLNPERVSQPDIDTDFADTRRDDVLRYVEQKYGTDRVAQIITFGTMAARAAVRDVGRVMGFSYGYCDRIAKLIPMFSNLDHALAQTPELRALVEQDSDAERLMRNAKKLEGVARHTSTHACAVVITKEPLDHMVPLQVVDQTNKTVITQYSMNPIEHLGLLKMDFLGLKNLTVIENTIAIVAAIGGGEINIENLPLDDAKTFDLLKSAATIGVFQLESSGMRRYLKQLQPTEMEDLIAMVSLYRPGPMEFIPDYIDGKHGRRTITYIDERLRPILEKTYGIAVYQEQVSEIARQLAGFSYGEADVLRKAVAKKIRSLLHEQGEKLISGMMQKGMRRDVAEKIWEFILPFARYGFNRSHAACYAMIAYRTAYLKANFPAQFMAALMTGDEHNTDRIALEIKHARAMGIEVLPPDINESFGNFTVVKESLDSGHTPRIRFGLNAVKNVGTHIVDVIIAERKSGGRFVSLENFLSRVHDKDLNKKSLESFIKVGALDAFEERKLLLENCEVLLHYAKRSDEEHTSGQSTLFGALAVQPKITFAPIAAAELLERLQWEKELLGLYLSAHPFEPIQHLWAQGVATIASLRDLPSGATIQLRGMVTSVKKIITKSGDPMLFAGFQDPTGEMELLVFPSVYKETSILWEESAWLSVEGSCNDSDGTLKFAVERAQRFDPTPHVSTATVHVTVPEKMQRSLFGEFQRVLDEQPGEFHVFLNVNGKKIDTHKTVPHAALEKIQELFGQESVDVVQ